MRTRRQQVSIAAGILMPVVIFLGAREAASWRPQKLVGLPYGRKVAISPDEKFIANAGNNLLTVRDMETGAELYHEPVLSWQGILQPVEVEALTFSPDSRQLALCWSLSLENGATQKMGIRLMTLGVQSRNFAIPTKNFYFDSPTQLRFSPDGQTLWLASTDNFRAWDLKSGQLIRQWRQADLGRSASVPYFSVLSPDCQMFFHSGEDGFSIRETKTGKLINHYKLEGLSDGDVEMSPEASLLICDDLRKKVRWVVEPLTGKRLWKGTEATQLLSEKLAYARTSRKTVDMYDSRSGQRILSISQLANLDALLPARDESKIYALDAYGQLWRQRIR